MPLNDNDMDWLVGQIAATAELLGHEIKPNAAALLAEDLAAYDRGTLAAALKRVRSEHTGKLTPKAIIDRIDELMGRPVANEAWAVASQALDERATVVWTREMADAWEVARPLAAGRDMVGARMAFIGAYERLVRAARDERRLPEVSVSLGWDGEGRRVAVEKAASLGYVTREDAELLLPAPDAKPGFNPVALLSGRIEATADATPETRERLRVLRDEMAGRDEQLAAKREADKRAADKDWADRKAAAQRAVDEHLRQEQRADGAGA